MGLPGVRPAEGSGEAAAQPLLARRYRLLEIIGRGGMAAVYRAIDTALDRPVAVKLLHRSVCGEAEFVDQFLRMERRIAGLIHPNLVTIYDAGATDDGCFAVMEYVAGGSLRELVARDRRLPVGRVVRIAAQVADALDLLHRDRIIHGDVKPDNVLLDDEGNAKLVDFGIAHLATTTASIKAESLGGSVPYLAPEQLESGRADARSDVYSLGLVLYELLAGRRAFGGENWVAVVAQRVARDPTPLREVAPEVPPALESVVMRALARSPDERYETAAALRRALLATDEERARADERAAPSARLDSPGRPAALHRRSATQRREDWSWMSGDDTRMGGPQDDGEADAVLPRAAGGAGVRARRGSTRTDVAVPLLGVLLTIDVLLFLVILALGPELP